MTCWPPQALTATASRTLLDQNGLRSNLLAQQQELGSTGHKKEGHVLLGSGQVHVIVMRSAIA